MKIQLQVAITFLLFLIQIQEISSGQVSGTSGVRWTCICTSSQHQTQSSIVASNCSTSCDCQPDTGSTGKRWICSCNSGLLPSVANDEQNSNCFTACNCTSGSFTGTRAPRKHISSKIVLIILLVCLVLTTCAFIASVVCYFYQRDKFQPHKFFSDKGSSYNSGTDLLSHRPLSRAVSKTNVSFLTNSVAGCISIASLLFKRKMGIVRSSVIQFSYAELEHATKKFSDANLIGFGGSSHVYRGHLKDGRTVAVKRLKICKRLDSDSEFSTEVEIISRLHHCHIVPLLGYCSASSGKRTEMLLVFEYLPNGNLRDCLDGDSEKNLNWSTRLSIALGAARGLEYLHEAAAPRIFHRDVKSTNILLDENWKAKLTDLGMAKRLSTDGFPSCSSSPERMQGTFGYFAPEYAIVGKGSLKSDVFSFGVVLLELITGRTPIFSETNRGEESLVIWAAPRLSDSKRVTSELPDPRLKGNFPEEEMQIVAYLAKECLLLDPESRPSMSEVVQILSTIAPDKSRGRRFSINLFQNLTSHSVKSQPSIPEKPTNQVEVVVDSEELRQMCPSRWSSGCSLSSEIDRTLLTDSIAKEVNLSSTQYIDTLLFLASNSRRNANDDDEIVDLTEPRLETFSVGNIQ